MWGNTIKVCVCWKGGPKDGRKDDRVYSITHSGFIELRDWKGYKIQWDHGHYFNVATMRLVDFNQEIRDKENMIATLRTLAEDDDFHRMIKKK